MQRRQFSRLAAVVAFAALLPLRAHGQTAYPVKPIRIVMPVPVGSALDVVIRLIGQELTAQLGQQIVVDNRPGAGGAIAAQAVVSAAPDGYTLLGGAASVFTILPAQKDKLHFDVNRDLTQIGMISRAFMVLAVAPELGVKTFAEFAALAKSKPNTLMLGGTGSGTLPHISGLALIKQGGVPITFVPYNAGGTADAVRDVMGGRIHGVIEAPSGLLGQIQSGGLRVIAVMSAGRDAMFPGVGAVSETIPGFEAAGFMAAPVGTPMLIIAKLNEALRLALEKPAVKARFTQFAILSKSMTPAETRAYIDADQNRWWPLVRQFDAGN
jgi:tripartite-type tricarboxylate transporter receptor subunit TctC